MAACQSAATNASVEYFFRGVATGNYYMAVADPIPGLGSTPGGGGDPILSDQLDDGISFGGGGFVLSSIFAHNRLTGSTFYDFSYGLLLSEEDETVASLGFRLPVTGLPPQQATRLPFQPEYAAYDTHAELHLKIPAIGVELPIVGVPLANGEWDVRWLGNQAGFLAGSAFPTWGGTTVITAHNWNARGVPGPFHRQNLLAYGDRIEIGAWGGTYIYEVVENILISPHQVKEAFAQERNDWVTLLICESYDPSSEQYLYRRMVRAVLVSVDEVH